MKIRTRRILTATIAAVVLITMFGAAALAGPDAKTTSGVYWFGDDSQSVGSSVLRRTDDGVRMSFKSKDMAPNTAVTIWWVVFNEPGACSAPGCGEDDIFLGGDPNAGLNFAGIEAADIVAGYATGKVASSDGNLNVNATLAEGEIGPEVIFGTGALLKDANLAEVHLVARSHGPAIDGLEDIQTGSFAGGCEVFLNPPDVPDAEGECGDIQFAVHLP